MYLTQAMYYWTKDIVIDPNDASQNTWYAGVFSGWGGTPPTVWADYTEHITGDKAGRESMTSTG